MFGEPTQAVAGFSDLSWYELSTLITLVILIIYLGVFPNSILVNINASIAF
jgi:NADH:ubiquinone oxidoreductase subunit 4 (subunit M)